MASYPNASNGAADAALPANIPAPTNGSAVPGPLIDAPSMPGPVEESNWDEVQAEARAAPLLPKYWGTTSSAAVWNPVLLKAMYDLHQRSLEKIALFTNALPWWALMGGMLLGFLVGMGAMITQQDTGRSTGDWGLQHVVITMVFCGALAYAMGSASRRLRWYNAVYGDALILEYLDRANPWRITRIGLSKLPRLSFVAETDDYYFGSTDESGIDKGTMLLKANEGTGGLMNRPLRQLFDLPAGGGGFTGTSSRSLQAMIDESEEMAASKRRMRQIGKKRVGELAFYVLLIVMAFLTFMQAGSGFQVDPSAIDPASVGESLVGGSK